MLRLDFNLVFTILNILIWYVLIRKFLFKPINNIITKREEALNARYDEVNSFRLKPRLKKIRVYSTRIRLKAKRLK